MPKRRSSIVLKALRDAGIGFAVYSGIVAIALEDRAQAGSAMPTLPTPEIAAGHTFWSNPSILTLFVIGLLFASLTAFTLSVWRHLGQNYALNRSRTEPAQIWSISKSRPYQKK